MVHVSTKAGRKLNDVPVSPIQSKLCASVALTPDIQNSIHRMETIVARLVRTWMAAGGEAEVQKIVAGRRFDT